MRFLLPLLLVGSLLAPTAARAQIDETFADGDFTNDPAWTGETDVWSVVPFGADLALRSDGPAASDTLHLATPSDVSFGTWSFTVAYDEGLSNFNKVRLYLLADVADLEDDVRGYYLELGTNARDVVLYRSDPERASGRVELAASMEDVLPAEADTLRIVTARTDEGTWSVQIDGNEVLRHDETEPTVASSRFIGVWVKHSSTRNRAYYFDDVHVEGEASIPDTTPPTIQSASYSDDLPGFLITFSEAIDFTTVQRSDFTVSGGVGQPVGVSPTSGNDTTGGVTLQLASALASGTYEVTASGVADVAGNVLADTTVSVVIEVDDTPPTIAAAEAVASDSVRVTFDEPVRTEACAPSTYAVSDGIGTPIEVVCPAVTPEAPAVREATLVLGRDLVGGQPYTLTGSDLTDVRGNVRTEATATFVYVQESAVPEPGAIVINEFNYRAFGSDLEYVELHNLTERSFDLRDLAIVDENREAAPLSETPRYLLPAGYAVLVRDSAAFASRFPAVDVVVPPDWAALNNGGDDIVLLHDGTIAIDSLHYSSSWGTSSAAVERLDPHGPSSIQANWAASTDPRGGTPAERNSVYAIDTTPPDLLSAVATEVGDSLRAVFSEPLDPATVLPGDFTIRGGTSSGVTDLVLVGEIVWLALAAPLATGDFTLTVADVADYSGNVLVADQAAFTVFRGAEVVAGDLVINEVYADTPTRGEPEEFVEILNVSSKTFDLSDLAFADEESDPVPLAEASRPFGPGEYRVIVRDGEAFEAAFPGVSYIAPSDWPALNNGGDVPTLLSGGTVVDAVPYESDWGEANASLERIDPNGPSDHAVNWAASTAPQGATPGARNSVYAPDAAAPRLVFVEQVADTVLLATFDEPLDAVTVAANHFDADGTTPLRVNVLESGRSVRLVFAGSVDALELTVTDVADLTGNARASDTAPVAVLARAGDLVINELMFAPATDSIGDRPPAPEYVELLSRSTRLLSLRGLTLTSSAGTDTFAVASGAAALPPEGYAVLFAAPEAPSDPAVDSRLAAAFPDTRFADLGTTLLPVERSTLDLSNSGEVVRVHRADGFVLDAVPYDPAWHSPDLEDERGVALERIDPAGDGGDGTNWSSATVPEGGTPGRPNSILVEAGAPPSTAGLRIEPSPFSPDGDGLDDFTTIVYTLDAAPATVRARIYNQTGRLVRTLTPATLAGPTGRLTWDGRDDDGRRLRMGIYVVVLDAVAAEEGRTEAYKAPLVLARMLR